jgi:hypothetical protein
MGARLALLLGAALASAGCEPRQAPPAPAPAAAQPTVEPRQDLPDEVRALDLFGAWSVDAIVAPTNVRWDQGWPMTLLAGSRQVEILSQCVTIGPFDYGVASGGLLTMRMPEAPREAANSPTLPPRPAPVQCARALSPAEQMASRILLRAERGVSGPDDTVILESAVGSLRLRRPPGPLANPRGNVPPPERPPLIGAWRFVQVNGRTLPPGGSMELLLRRPIIEWRSGCVNEARTLSVEGDRLLPGPIDPFPVCERGRSQAELAIARLTSGPILTTMQRSGRLTLTGSGITAELVPLTS